MLYAEDFSPNTPQGACPDCHGLGRVYDVTEQSMVPDPTRSPSASARSPRGRRHGTARTCATSWSRWATTSTCPGAICRRRTATGSCSPKSSRRCRCTPASRRRDARRAAPQDGARYMGTFTGARKYVLHTFATTQSALMKKRVARFMVGSVCPVLRRQAAEARGAVGHLRRARHRRRCRSCRSIAVAEVLAPGRRGPLRRDAASDAPTLEPRGIATARRPRAASPPAARRTPARPTCAARPTCRKKSASPRSASRTTWSRASARCRRSASAICRWTAARRRCRRANCSGCAWRRRSARNLFGVVYVLDEPSAGLHPADSEALLRGAATAEGGRQLDLRRRARPRRDAPRRLDRRRRARCRRARRPGPLQRAARRPGATSRRRTRRATCSPRRAPRTERRDAARLARSCEASPATTCSASMRVSRSACFTAVTGVSGSGKSSLVSQALLELMARTWAATCRMARRTRTMRSSPAPETEPGRVTWPATPAQSIGWRWLCVLVQLRLVWSNRWI